MIKTKLTYFTWITLLIIVAAVYSSIAFSAEVRIGITPATENEDGSAIPASGPGALNRTSVGWWVCGESDSVGDTNWTDFPPDQPEVVITYPDDAATYCFRAAHRTNGDPNATPPIAAQWSDRSNVVQKTIVVIPPPPTSGAGPSKPPVIIIITQ
jgi:hypothetical protein